MSDQLEDLYPLSPLQQGMFFHDLQARGEGLYLNQLACELRGPLHLEAFERAWQQVAGNHPVLRTAVEWEDVDEPLQVVLRDVEVPVHHEDWRATPPDALAARLESFLDADRLRGFELSRPPLFRLALLRTGDDVHRFVFTHHHLLLDGWSMPIVLEQVFSAYDALRKGQTPPLERPRPFRDYIAWLEEQPLEEAERYWRRALAGFSAPTPVRVAGMRRAGTGRADRSGRLGAEATARLVELSKKHGVTFNTIVQGAWALLLAHESGSEDVVFGSTVSGRPAALRGVERMVGLFINTLPVRVDTSPAQPVSAWLRRLQAEQLEARQFEHTPLVRLQRWTDVPPGSPLFESLVVFENYPLDAQLASSVPGLEVREVRALEVDHFPLTLTSSPGRELPLLLSYDRSRFDDADAERLLGRLLTILEGLARSSEGLLTDVTPLRPAERDQVLGFGHRGEKTGGEGSPFTPSLSKPGAPLLHRRFETAARRHADRPALVGDTGEALTYSELDERANAVAHQLRTLGMVPETKVALCLPRSPDAVIALLGVLKAGGAWIPLDPAYPEERLRLLVEDSGAQLVLCAPGLASSLQALGVRTLGLDEGRAPAPPDVEVSAHNLAYVLYTSGSTGRPKGVMVSHRSVCHTLAAEHRLLQAGVGTRVLQFASLSFDASISEVFSALLHGGVLHVPGRETLVPGEALAAEVRARGIEVAQLPPSVLAATPAERLPALKTVVSSGEACSAEVVRRWSNGRRFLNVYGPTEATISATAAECRDDGFVPAIGTPLGGVRAYVLDRHLRPVGVRVEGELYLGGPGVSRGYLGAPARTAERFLPDPLGAEPGARLYRTGDRVFWREDGQLEFVGRVDHQVKLRGFRIELGEIEAAIASHRGVTDAVVVVRGDAPAERQLVAYVVAPAEVRTATVREQVRAQLPDHMVPTAWVRLEAFPLTPQGKIDRRALPAPDSARPEWARAFTEPETATERALAEIWSEVLNQPRVGRDDHFFELGGHSLLATQVASRVRTRLGFELPLRAIFESPTLSALAARLDAPAVPDRDPIMPAPRTGPLPLSFAQERLWFLWQLDPESPAYNLPGAFRLRGVLDVGALERALREVVARHEALRTTFATENGSPVQRVGEPTFTLRTVELGGLSREQAEREIAQRVRREALAPFDLEHGPLVRALRLRLTDEEHVLVVAMHHIVSDGWSTAIFIRELASLYEAFARGEPSPLPPPALQYADFARWQRTRLDEAGLAAELAWWKETLAGCPPLLALPTDRPRPAVQRFEGESVPLSIPAPLWRRVLEFGQREGVTPFMCLLAAYEVVLARWSGQHDFAVGAPIAGRTRPELEGMIGFFVNTLVLRAQLTPELDYRGLVQRVKDTALGAFAHQELPFERLVEALQPDRELSHPPLFQVLFTLQNVPSAAIELPGLSLTPEPVEAAAAKFDLTLSLEETSEGAAGALVFNRALFDRDTAERFVAHFTRVLEHALASPELPLSRLTLLTAPERTQLVERWSHGAEEQAGPGTLIGQFEGQADRTPDATAVTCGNARLTFAELDHRANALAHHLRREGVGPDVLVGVCVERTVDLVVAVLGVLKAGGAYLPLDPHYPPERLRLMVEDSGVGLVIGERRPELGASVRAVPVPRDGDASRLPDATHSENLAYAIYTSGSTGRPKAVGVRRSSVSNLVHALDAAVYAQLGTGRRLRVSLNGSISFDTSVKQLFQLLRGHAIDVTPEDVRFDGAAFLGYLQTQQVEVLDCTPTQLQLLLEAGLLEASLPLKAVLVGGEAISPTLWRTLRQSRAIRFFNVYGPTECTVDATVCELNAAGEHPTLGRSIANVRIYVLDPAGEPTPIGVPGELHLGGAGVARGYLGRPGATAERFVPDPFTKEPGARLYRTGDRARWRADGTLEFLGRTDHQVKLRGHRIELGEVEEALRGHADVRDAVAMPWEYGPGDLRLVAWIACDDPVAFDASHVRGALASRLPEAMVPSAFVPLAALPVSPNGKLDRKALPAPDAVSSPVGHSFVAPRDEVETRLARIWEDALGGGPVGANDHFFERGGHSLLATRVVSRIRSELGVELPLRAVFEAPVLSSLALRIRQAPLSGGATPLAPVPRSGPLPLSYAQQRLWFLAQLEPDSTAYHVAHAVRLRGRLDVAALERSLEAIVARHEILRTSFPVVEGQPLQRIHPPAPVRLRRARVGLEELQALAEAEGPFELETGPLIRATLSELGENDHALVVTMHHLVTDGWSTSVFASELAEGYRAFVEGRAPGQPPLPVQYVDFAAAQRGWLEGGALASQLEYWKRALSGIPASLALPHDRPRPAEPSHRAGTVPIAIEAGLLARVQSLANQEGCSLFMVLLAGLQTLLARCSGQGDVIVGTPIAGRTRQQLEPLIGLFVNTLALRGRFDANPTFRELLAQLRETTLAAYAHQDVPFEKIVEAVNPTRDGGQPPIFQVLLVLQNTPRAHVELPGLTLSPLELSASKAKVDLSFALEERDAGLVGVLDYDADLFDPTTAARLGAHWRRLLLELVAQPDVPVNQLAFLEGEPPGSKLSTLDERVRREGFVASTAAPAVTPPRRRHLAPSGPDEEALAALWRELLHVERVGREDDFFELGGHSLLATQLWSRIRARFGVELPLRALFDAPVLTDQAKRLGAARANVRPAGLPAIVRTGPKGGAPLSFAQQRLWFLQQLATESAAWNLPYAVRLTGELEADALTNALAQLIERHEALRTRFPAIDGAPAQQLEPAVTPEWRRHDLRSLPPGERASRARELLDAELRRPFDLARGPVLRPTLIQLADAEHWLLLCVHHIASDGWSSPILLRELAALYEGQRSGRPASLPSLPVQYADFAATQRAWLEGGEAEAQLEYWRRQLEGAPSVLRLPMDRPASARTGRGARYELALDASLRERIHALAREAGATPFMVLLAAFQTLLFRVTGQDDLVIGSPVAGRSRPELEGLIGFFVNTLALRTRISPDLTFRALLAQVRETSLGAFAHQDVPFEQVVEAVSPQRDLHHAPLFQVLFTLDREADLRLELPGLSFEGLDLEPPASKLDLALSVAETASGYRAAFSYDPGLFDAETIARLGDQLARLLDGATERPGVPVAELPLSSAVERRRLLDEWNRTEIEVPSTSTLHGLFLAQAARTPSAVAFSSGEEQLTYAQLAAMSGALAHRLVAAGVGPEIRVGIALDRSPRMVAALLAVLEAGGAYVPIDPTLPRERIAFLCRDAAVQLVLTTSRLAETLPTGVAWLDVEVEERVASTGASPASRARAAEEGSPDRLAYVLYTSGSTGQPKGVMVSHRNICNRMLWVQRTWPLGGDDAVLLRAPLAFDVSVSELFWPLSCGARVVLAKPGTDADPKSLARVVAAENVTVLHFVPSMLQAFLEVEGVRDSARSVRHVLCGGESLLPELAALCRGTLRAQLHQLYGPTEASIDATAWTVESFDPPIPIGRPTSNARVYVLDPALQPVPPGVIGELYLAGAGVTRGYFGRPALTAERFLPDPFGSEGSRMYRTGDLARWRPDGTLVFAGRVDHQVKLRGVRVELGEIEAVLSGQRGVEACAVLLRDDGSVGQRLVAYVEARPGAVNASELEVRARAQLPQAIVPAAFVLLESLPRSDNGKIDRRRLPAPALPAARSSTPPRNELERTIAQGFEELLDVRPVGVEDDFFALGGHSLLAVRLAARVGRALGREVPLEAIFRAPTVGTLAERLRADHPESSWVELRRGGSRAPLILVHALGGHLGGYRELVDALGDERPIFGLQLVGEVSFTTLEALARRHVEVIRAQIPRGPYVLGGWSAGGVIAFEMARQLVALGESVETVLLLDSFAPGSIETLEQLDDEALLRSAGAAHVDLPPELVRPMLERVRAIVKAVAAYRPGRLDARTVLVRAADARRETVHPPDHGWQRHVTGPLEQQLVPGSHESMLQRAHASELARVVGALIGVDEGARRAASCPTGRREP